MTVGTEEVSRETAPSAPPTPDAARGAFPRERLELAERYAASLATDGVARGLIGPREAPRLWERHLLNCAALAEAIPGDASVADIGAGAGLPGLVLAIARPDLRVTLIESLLRRTRYLEEVVAELGLSSVTVLRSRAEDAVREVAMPGFDVVTSRAVAPLPRLVEWSMPLVAPTGVMLAMKGASAADEIAEALPVLRRLGAGPAQVVEVGMDSSTAVVVRVPWADPSRVSWRATGGSGTSGSARSHPGGPRRRRGAR